MFSSCFVRSIKRELSDAVELMDRVGFDRVLASSAPSYLCDALRQDRRYDEAIRRSVDLVEPSRSIGLRGHEASALRDRGCSQAALGREEETLESLEEAVRLRRSLPQVEANQQSTSSLDAFLRDYGLVLRQASFFDKAVNTFLEIAKIARANGNIPDEALANSEIA